MTKGMKRRTGAFPALALLLAASFFFPSCSADSARRITLTYPASISRPNPSASSAARVRVIRFADDRGMADVVGGIYEKFVEPRPVWIVVNDLCSFLAEALISELRDTGVAVTPEEMAGDYRAEGRVNVFYGWATAASPFFTASVNVDISLFDRSRLVFARSYLAEKTADLKDISDSPARYRINIFLGPPTRIADGPTYQSLLLAATAEAMKRAAKDIRDYLAKEADRGKL